VAWGARKIRISAAKPRMPNRSNPSRRVAYRVTNGLESEYSHASLTGDECGCFSSIRRRVRRIRDGFELRRPGIRRCKRPGRYTGSRRTRDGRRFRPRHNEWRRGNFGRIRKRSDTPPDRGNARRERRGSNIEQRRRFTGRHERRSGERRRAEHGRRTGRRSGERGRAEHERRTGRRSGERGHHGERFRTRRRDGGCRGVFGVQLGFRLQ